MISSTLIAEFASFLPENKIKVNDSADHPLGNGGKVTVYPSSLDEIVNVVKYANDHDRKVTVVGSGTKRGFGGLDKPADILLSLENYSGIIEHTVGNMTLTVKAGTVFNQLQHYLKDHKQKVSLDAAWPDHATIGGIIAANDSSAKRLGYGSARDVVIGLKTVYPDGSIIRSGGKVVKNVAGYDMNKLFVGSMGTLGVIAEITMKLRPLPKDETLVLLTVENDDLETIRSFVVSLLDTQLEPTSLELLAPSLSEKLTQIPKYTLAMSFEDVESSVAYQEDFLKKLKPAQTTMNVLKQENMEHFWNRFYTIGPNGAVSNTGDETVASIKVSVKNLDVLEVIKESNRLRDSHNLDVEAHGGLGHGICQIHVKGAKSDVVSAIHHLRGVAEKYGGHAVIKHLPYKLRQEINVWGENPPYFYLLDGIKKQIDPKRTLNNTRFVGGI
ncbi:FAD-binding oxidoreductase [Salipaludibacillus keqinensis]|uniref:FAD-binding oxidoreductase n=1 Tax=Salipaludibacillus keqinensis TaxID=2045207 RepID=A0A323TLI7_9BACI|nr:FAD-binding oxidoreductase [Salipaludibacillus keqinensis]PYZ94956.1 FAD-binding oxidoreductase [Salipaludibacillus keqinensis]